MLNTETGDNWFILIQKILHISNKRPRKLTVLWYLTEGLFYYKYSSKKEGFLDRLVV